MVSACTGWKGLSPCSLFFSLPVPSASQPDVMMAAERGGERTTRKIKERCNGAYMRTKRGHLGKPPGLIESKLPTLFLLLLQRECADSQPKWRGGEIGRLPSSPQKTTHPVLIPERKEAAAAAAAGAEQQSKKWERGEHSPPFQIGSACAQVNFAVQVLWY